MKPWKHQILRETLEEFTERTTRTIRMIPLETINKTIASMGNRIEEVKRLKGQRTKY
jgi:hypothetical protein